jgi:hypothetical protein
MTMPRLVKVRLGAEGAMLKQVNVAIWGRATKDAKNMVYTPASNTEETKCLCERLCQGIHKSVLQSQISPVNITKGPSKFVAKIYALV